MVLNKSPAMGLISKPVNHYGGDDYEINNATHNGHIVHKTKMASGFFTV